MGTVKYMGSADVRILEKGETFAGRLGEPLSKGLVFSRENNWVVDSEEVGLSDAALALLLEEKLEDGTPAFRDVSGKERVPTNLNQQMFLGMKKTEDADTERSTDSSTESDPPAGAAGAGGGGNQGAGGARGGRTGRST